MSDLDLMRQVFTRCGGTIRAACAAFSSSGFVSTNPETRSVPESFLAALVANESGGDSNAKRFEKGVLASLWEVCASRKASYGSIGRQDLLLYLLPTAVSGLRATGPEGDATLSNAIAGALLRLDSLATSWGLTQIMGYHVLEVGKQVDVLRDPRGNLDFALVLLAQFAARFQLDPTKEFPELFRCWNTGRPDGVTFDPQYVQHGMERMDLWHDVAPASDGAAGSPAEGNAARTWTGN